MKTLKTTLVILTVISFSTASFAQSSFLDKAKDAAKKKNADKALKKKDKIKGGKGTEDIAVKGTGVPTNATATKPATTTVTPAATNK